eukprot:EG_transcript_875
MGDFLAEEELCGQTLLRLVSRGSAIIAELLRLAEHIPPVFFPDCDTDREFQEVLADFGYLRGEDEFERRIRSHQRLLDLDVEFRETHTALLHRFYLLFEAVYKYVSDYNKFLQDVEDGVFIQQTYESIFVNTDGKQLMAEALYLYGVMLLLLDQKIEGVVRERLLVSYLRNTANVKYSAHFDEVCKLCRQTGFSMKYGKAPGQHPVGYPEEYFARVAIKPAVIRMTIGRLRSDDVYQMAANYPDPEHRSTALSTQAAMLYVILFFHDALLKAEGAAMREIVDKHFPDNWVINWYMGFAVDLAVAWAPYKAASRAIETVLQGDSVRRQVILFTRKLMTLNVELHELLQEGILTEEYVLDHVNSKLLPLMRDANVTLRWLTLHRTAQTRKIKDTVIRATAEEEVLKLMIGVAQLEFTLKEMFKMLLKGKRERWTKAQDAAVQKLSAIAEYFGGEQLLASERREEQLQAYFSQTAENIADLDSHDPSTSAGRKLTQLYSALEEVEQFHQVYDNLQVRQYLIDTRGLLKKMLRYVNIKEEVLVTISVVGDMSYAWETMDSFVPIMQIRIKKQPSSVLALRTIFLKLVSILELPLTRIAQCGSADLASVSQYYSEVLVRFVGQVLDIIPASMFEVLNSIMELQTNVLRECPTKIPRQALGEYTQADARYELAKLSYQVSNYTMGILAMKKTLVGVIHVDPHKLLEEGVRKALVGRLSATMHEALHFPRKDKTPFMRRLTDLGQRLNGMRSSFEYIQDYIRLYGLRIWQEEMQHIIAHNVEQECNQFLKKKVLDWDSGDQGGRVPIPRYPPLDEHSVNFMGRLVRELQAQTDPRRTVYVNQLAGWYDEQKEVVGLRTVSLIRDSLGVFGLTGASKLLSFMTVKEVQTFVKYVDRAVLRGFAADFDALAADLNPPEAAPRNAARWYDGPLLAKLGRNFFPTLLEGAMRIGRNQLLRRHLASELTFTCKLDSQALWCSLRTLNQALLEDVRLSHRQPDQCPYPDGDNPLLAELAAYLENVGLTHPLSKVYATSEPLPDLPLVLALLVLSCLGRFKYEPAIDCLTARKKDEVLDGTPFAVGIITVLKQFHSDHTASFVGYLAQYVCHVLGDVPLGADKKSADVPVEVVNALHFLELGGQLAPWPRDLLDQRLPPPLRAGVLGDGARRTR